MKLNQDRVLMEYRNGSWYFNRAPYGSIRFEQAIVDVVSLSATRVVVGYVISSYGVLLEELRNADTETRHNLGIGSPRPVSRRFTPRRVRLMPDGAMKNCT